MTETTKKAHRFEHMQSSDVTISMWPLKEAGLLKSGTATDMFQETQTGNEPVSFLNGSKNCPTKTQETENNEISDIGGVYKILLSC